MNSQELWQRALTVIPNGNSVVSKHPDRFLPKAWPTYYESAWGCMIEDFNGALYQDFAQMGVGACILGYAHPVIDEAVQETIARGVMCTLNSPLEVKLAEKLVALHPWSQMVRFARTGGEACTIAYRIAEASIGTGRDFPLFTSGYHGWHDWYKKNGYRRRIHAFSSYAELEYLVEYSTYPPGIVVLEPALYWKELLEIKTLTDKHGLILIFDEVTSGFRETIGGYHLQYGINPDLCVLGKALGNGYAISAVVGTEKVMLAAKKTFISSTFFSEAIGFAAALAVIDYLEKHDVFPTLTEYGLKIRTGLLKIALDTGINLSITGIPALNLLQMDPVCLTYYTQEMLKLGFLVSSTIYATYAYTPKLIDKFLAASAAVFQQMDEAGKRLPDLIEHGIIQTDLLPKHT